MNTTAFFEALARRARGDTSVVSLLRRSLAFDPGAFPAAFPLVEPFTSGLSQSDRRTVYLAAGLWATAQRRESGVAMTLPAAMARLQRETGSASIESRFVTLLDADPDELVWRLRHVITLVASSGHALDWPNLLTDLLRWGQPSRFVQQQWARLYWQQADSATPRAETAASS